MADQPYSAQDTEKKGDDAQDPIDVLEEGKARFTLCEEAYSEIRSETLADLTFASGDQWDPEIRATRKAQRRPCLTVNRVSQHIKQITNDQRQNRPSIKVYPVDDKADKETAKVLSGMTRHIEYNSGADSAYDTAFDSAVRGGLGFYRVITDYVSPTSFDQDILIKRIKNPLSVMLDPHSKEADGSDANYGFVVDRISKDEFKRKYPKAKLSGSGEWEVAVGYSGGWVTDKSVRIAEYFYKVYESARIVLLSDGTVVEKSKLAEYVAQNPGAPLEIVDERTTDIPKVKWAKLNGCETLEETDWLGSFIPIIPVYGEELDIDGKRILKGIVRDAKDPQQMLNVWKSAETEAIGLAPKAPYIAAAGQIEKYKNIWETANTANHAYLPYDPQAVNGTILPPPQRQTFEPAVQAITQAAMLAADDLKATTGIYDAALGAKSNETSGVAIQRRNNQAQTSNFHFVDNLTRSIRHTGRIIIELIPKIYDTVRVARIIGEDGTHDVVTVNAEFKKDGVTAHYDLSKGKYDVVVDVGPSYATKRQEAVASMIDVSKAAPQVMQVAGDLMIKNMDWPGAEEIADRIKKTLPPGLADDPKKTQDVPPQVQAQMGQLNQMVEQLTAQLNEKNQQIENKTLELESKERIEMAKLETQASIELAKLQSNEAIQLLVQQIKELDARTKMLGFGAPTNFDESSNPDVGAMGAGQDGMEQGLASEPEMDAPAQTTEGMNDDPSNF